MAAAVKHARIGGDVSSPVTTGKYLQTSSAAKKTPTDQKTTPKSAEEPKSATSDLINRRRSTFKGVASSLMTMRRMTKGSMDKDNAAAAAAAAAAKPKMRMENTYRLSPSEDQRFKSCRADEVIMEVLNTHLNGQSYDAVKAPTMAAMLSEQVKRAVKGLHCERYKLVTNVVVGPVCEQGLVVASRCLWDCSSDSSSTVTFNNGNIFAIASVFAVYYE
ncbi:dynein light chain Tctex-type protein 2B-like [Babylonia areolata]|uniref:dynein light chain Tctex-type protein 2B-like n=1 Tax=Babylonia areolata TaxID=304850 RepID=UPI003FD55DD0